MSHPDLEADPHSQFTLQTVLDTLDLPAFALDADGTVVAWDEQIASLLDAPRSAVLGSDSLGAALYDDDQRSLTLAEKVVEQPTATHEAFDGVSLADQEYALLSGDYVYEDTSTIDGTEIWFVATPVRDAAGDLVGVLEVVQDRSESARYQRELESLFTSLVDTIDAYEAGDFSARVEFGGEEETLVEDRFLRIVDELDDMGAALEAHFTEVQQDVAQIRRSSEAVAETSQDINSVSTEQARNMNTISGEVSNLSATVEEIASTADEVVETSEHATELAESGNAAATDAIGVMEDVANSADDVVDDVESLQSRVNEIDEIVEVITDIAEQTNMLALNASIEAARAGEAGDGFAVVADEVKDLAEESQENASRIEEMVAEIQSATDRTVSNLVTTTTQIDEGIDQVEDAMARFDEIVTAIKQATEGIEQVSDATDDQAASAEEIAAMVDEAVEMSDEISQSVDQIVSNTEEQTAMLRELDESVQEVASR